MIFWNPVPTQGEITWNILKRDQELRTELFSYKMTRWRTYAHQVSFLYGGTRHVFGDVVVSCLPTPALPTANCLAARAASRSACWWRSPRLPGFHVYLGASRSITRIGCLESSKDVFLESCADARRTSCFYLLDTCTLALMYLCSHSHT